MAKTPHIQDNSEGEDEATNKPEKTNSANVDHRQSGNENLTNNENSVTQRTSWQEEPLTPFVDEDFNMQGGEEESNDALDAGILSSPKKCGEIAKYSFLTSLEMQDTKFLTEICEACEVLMNQQCYSSKSNFFYKKGIGLVRKNRDSENIYDKERRWREE